MTPTRYLRSYCPMTNVTEFKKKKKRPVGISVKFTMF
jgi:hypothetical protein